MDPIVESLLSGTADRRKPPPAAPAVMGRPQAEQTAIQQALEGMSRGEGVRVNVGPYDQARQIDINAPIPTNSVVPSASPPMDAVLQSLFAPQQQQQQPQPIPQIPGVIQQPPYQPPSTLSRMTVGPLEAGMSMLTGAAAAIPAQIAGAARVVGTGKGGTPEGGRMAQERAREVMDSLTYRPRSQAGEEALEGIGSAFQASKIPPVWPIGGPGSSLASVAANQPRKAAAASTGGALGSVGAAGAGTFDQALAIATTPALRQVLEGIPQKDRGRINLDALRRHAEAESLPVPIRLTAGEATGDSARLSFEKNLRGTDKGLRDRFDEHNKNLVENTNRIREIAAPDIYVSSKPDLGNIVIDAYRAKDAALEANISAKYQALRDANGGQFPLAAKTFVKNADKALHKELLYDFVPAEVRRTLDRVATDGMTFENFEALRTNLARIQRSQSADGNAKAAAGVIRNTMEELPLPPKAAHLKPLADDARAAAKERFSLIEGDPAYKSVVRGTASADKLLDKFIVAGDLRSVQTMVNNLDPVARQALAAGVVDYLKQNARLVDNAGNFSQSGYNRALEKVRPKLAVLFDAETKKHLETLGNVARYTQEQPRGSFVNNSNTLVGALAEAGREGAKSTLEGVANVAAHGVPVGTWTRKFMGERKQAKDVNEALKPGSGILLRDVR